MVGRRGVATAAALAANLAAWCGDSGAMAQEQALPLCGGAMIAQGTVGHVIDVNTFTLDDGREVRLAAIEVPPPAQRRAAPPPRPPPRP